MGNEPSSSITSGPARDAINAAGARVYAAGNVYIGGGATSAQVPDRPAALPTTNFPQAGRVHNLTFVGRVTQLKALHAALTASPGPGHHSAAAITQGFSGEGGIGKSQLAQRYAEDYADHWAGRWWIDCAQTAADDATGVLRPSLGAHRASLEGLAALLGVTLPKEQPVEGDASGDLARRAWFKAARGEIQRALSDGRAHLVILDNVERSDTPGDPWDVVKELTPAAPARVILTTRDQRLPASLATLVPLDVLTKEEARELFRKRFVNRQAANETQTPNFADADLDALTAHLSGHSLAVDLAAAYLFLNEGLTPKALLAELEASDEATVGFFDKPRVSEQAHAYRLSVAKTLMLHVGALGDGPALRMLFAAAFASPDEIPLDLLAEAAGVDANQAPIALGDLVARSLVEREHDGEKVTVSIHRLTQVALRARLANEGEAVTVNALSEWLTALLDFFEDVESFELTSRQIMARIHAESVIAAAERLKNAKMLADPLALLRGKLALHLSLIGQVSTAATHIDIAIAWGQAQSPQVEPALACWYSWRASIRRLLGDLSGAESDIDRAIEWAKANLPDRERHLNMWLAARAGIREDCGNLFGAEEDIEKVIMWGEAQPEREERTLAIWYAWRANTLRLLGHPLRAQSDIQKAIDWAESQLHKEERILAMWRAWRADIQLEMGNLEGAESSIEESIAWEELRAFPNRRELAVRYASRARIRQSLGQYEAASMDVDAALKWFQANLPNDGRTISLLKKIRSSIDNEISWWRKNLPSERG